MSPLPRPLARRVDRLARRAHSFHRFAHHPLCDAYREETFRIGRRTRVCAGCSLSWAGALSGAAAGAVLAQPSPRALGAAFGLWSIAAVAWMAARALGFGRGSSKWISRFLPYLGAGALAAMGLRRGSALGAGVALGSAALVALALWTYRRSGPDRSACASCQEREKLRTCSGLRPIVRRELAFQRLAGRWIEAALERRSGRARGC